VHLLILYTLVFYYFGFFEHVDVLAEGAIVCYCATYFLLIYLTFLCLVLIA